MLKSILKIPFILLAAAGFAHAGPYYDLGIGTSSATMKLSGVMKVAASSASYNTPVITLDGAAAKATIPEVHSAKTGPIFSWETGGATQSAIQGLFDYGYVSGFTIYDYQNSANGRLGLGTPYGPQLYGLGGLLNPRLGLNTSDPKYALDVTGGAHFTSSATADAGFYGDGSHLTGLTSAQIPYISTVVYTNGSYSNPAWITSLSTSKIDLSTVTSALNGKLTYPVTGLVSLGTYGLTTSSDVVAHAYYGDGSKLTGISSGGGLSWSKYTVTYSALSAAALTNSISLFTLPAGGIIHAVKIKHSTAFAGTSITTYNVSVGITGALAKYATAFDVLQAVAADTFQISNGLFSESHTATTDVKVTATSVGANLSAATQGSVDVWVLTSTAI